ncbi:MAG: SMP-30/gluconolactonase/LRE family protein [Bryobacterales bacterium]|nr:SMP-30/gluconolactonase/LRE family protein [Bryobacterales bacterium]
MKLPGILLLFLPATILTAQDAPVARQFELKALSPRFHDLIAADAQLIKVAGGFGFTEGPVWDPKGFVYVSDEVRNKIFRVFPDGRKEIFLSIVDPDGSTFDRNHHFITTASALRALIDVSADGSYKVIADRYEGKKFNSPNDVVLGPGGALYFTDPTLDLPKGEKQELDFQGVYRLDRNGSLRLLIRDLVQPNGLAFSPDGKRLYVDDTRQKTIHVYDVTPDGGVKNGRLFGKEEGPPHSGSPDGMRVDRKGNLYVTGPYGIWIWDPAGNHLGAIVLPEGAANLCWGDADSRTLYITATTSLYRIRAKARGYIPR